MSTPLRVLLVEDSEDDAALLLREVRRGGYDAVFRRVETAEAMQAALDADQWDIVISDFVLPRFSALAALLVLKKRGLDLPFIIVSGSIGEGIATAATKAGADDYVMKDDPGRLCAAIAGAIRAGERRRLKRADESMPMVTTP
jgi:CheY-like chemotaxis protein